MNKRYALIGPMLMFGLAACGGGQADKATGSNQNVQAATVETNVSAMPAVKWHPGHYGLSLQPYTPSPAVIKQIHSDWTAILNSNQAFVGVKGLYSWYNLEPLKQGEYNFKPIDDDIKWLNDNFPGKKLQIEIWTREFHRHQFLPAVPQNEYDSNSKIPDYIVSGAFDGSGGVSGATWNSNGQLAAFWSPAVLARLKALDAALAARYDGNPTVEVIKYDEYAPPEPSAGAPTLGWSRTNMINAWKELHTSMSKNWPTTNKVLLANWPSNSNGSADTTIMSFAQGIRTGVGGPDVLPPKTQNSPGETWGAMLLYGAGGAYGTTDYRGTIPVVYEAQNPSFKMTVTDIEEYAYTQLRATHLVWLYNPTNLGPSWNIPGEGTTPWRTADATYNTKGYPGVVDTLIAKKFRIHAECPTTYTGGCNTK